MNEKAEGKEKRQEHVQQVTSTGNTQEQVISQQASTSKSRSSSEHPINMKSSNPPVMTTVQKYQSQSVSLKNLVQNRQEQSKQHDQSYHNPLSSIGMCNYKNAYQVYQRQNNQLPIQVKPNVMRFYNDVSLMTDEQVIALTFKTMDIKNMRGRGQESSAVKLHSIIEWCSDKSNYKNEDCDYSSIVCWMPHGRAFKIHDSKLFTSKAIPRFFYQTKYSSFTR